jgi:hypothetical protein
MAAKNARPDLSDLEMLPMDLCIGHEARSCGQTIPHPRTKRGVSRINEHLRGSARRGSVAILTSGTRCSSFPFQPADTSLAALDQHGARLNPEGSS